MVATVPEVLEGPGVSRRATPVMLVDASGNYVAAGGGGSSDATAPNQVTGNANIGATTESAAATPGATSGVHGLIAGFWTAFLSLIGATNETAAANPAATSGLSGLFRGIWTFFGGKTDARSTATDTTSVSLMQVAKQISFSLQDATLVALTRGVQHTTITGTGETTIVAAGGASHFRNLYGLLVDNNDSADDTIVTLRDDTAGTSVRVFTVKHGESGGFLMDAYDGIPQAVANKVWTLQSGTAADLKITALYADHL